MTPRKLRWTAFAIALAMQVAMVIAYGSITDWCFCAILDSEPSRIPPPFVMRYLELATFPATRVANGLGVEPLFVFSLIGWFAALWVLLNAIAIVARLRLRPVRVAAAGRERQTWLAPRESVRPIHLLLMGIVLIAAGMTAGARYRRAWLAEAERVFAATMTAASAGRPLPRGVHLSMYERRGDDYRSANPEPAYVAEPDPRQSGDHPLDRFVVPYTYAGTLRFASGARYEFSVLREADGWSVLLHEPMRAPRR